MEKKVYVIRTIIIAIILTTILYFIATVSLITLAIILLISFFINIYVPLDCNFHGFATVNVNKVYKDNQQPIFLDKFIGVTYLLIAKFYSNEEGDTLESIEFKTNKISGLFNVKFDRCIFNQDDGKSKIEIYFSYGILNNKSYKREKVDLPINTQEVSRFEIQIYYKNILTGNYYEWEPHCPSHNNILDRGGRICILDCIHE